MINSIIRKQYDVIIAGAGPAGCSAANFLARQGHEVLLLDKAKFPRDKTCGDCISPATMNILDRIGVSNEIEARKPWKVDNVILSSPDGSIMKGKIPKVKNLRDYAYIFPRRDFDTILFNYTKAVPNITALENFKVTDLLYDDRKICGIAGKFNNQIVNITGKYIIGADGVNSVIAKKLNLFNGNNNHKAFAIRAYFENVSNLDSSIELHFDKTIYPGYGWIFPISDNKANVGAGTDMRSFYKNDQNLKDLFRVFIEKNKFAKEKLKNASMVENTFKGCLLSTRSYHGARHKDNVLLIGDAGSMIDPTTGEGIAYALRTGESAAYAIDIALSKKSNKAAGWTYKKIWKYGFNWRRFTILLRIRDFIMSKFLVNLLVFLASKDSQKASKLSKYIMHSSTRENKLYTQLQKLYQNS